tara:strand:+ start:6044 stop:6922 length:879 start_codon:yes stop_codon:yes gene_type:complete
VYTKFEKLLILVKIKASIPLGFLRETYEARNGAILSYYFDRKANAGDLIGPYLIEKIIGKRVANCRSRIPNHLLAVGSIMHEANARSFIWGAGCLGESYISDSVSSDKIFALRGKKTLAALEAKFGKKLEMVPLGDPAVLMPQLFQPEVKPEFKVGIIPHYWHYDKVKAVVGEEEGVHVIDIRCTPEELVLHILRCESILSTSLHGLILADSYNVPNKWLEDATSPLLGGRFKFHDYYSTTSNPCELPFVLESSDDIFEALERANSMISVKGFAECKLDLKQSLLNAFGFMN